LRCVRLGVGDALGVGSTGGTGGTGGTSLALDRLLCALRRSGDTPCEVWVRAEPLARAGEPRFPVPVRVTRCAERLAARRPGMGVPERIEALRTVKKSLEVVESVGLCCFGVLSSAIVGTAGMVDDESESRCPLSGPVRGMRGLDGCPPDAASPSNRLGSMLSGRRISREKRSSALPSAKGSTSCGTRPLVSSRSTALCGRELVAREYNALATLPDRVSVWESGKVESIVDASPTPPCARRIGSSCLDMAGEVGTEPIIDVSTNTSETEAGDLARAAEPAPTPAAPAGPWLTGMPRLDNVGESMCGDTAAMFLYCGVTCA